MISRPPSGLTPESDHHGHGVRTAPPALRAARGFHAPTITTDEKS